MAVIEFNLDGTIVTANSSFLGATGYTLEEIVGKKHRIFCDPRYADSKDYGEFWQRLNGGETIADTSGASAKASARIWLQATYNPVYSSKCEIYRVVKFATDVTKRMASVGILGDAIRELAAVI